MKVRGFLLVVTLLSAVPSVMLSPRVASAQQKKTQAQRRELDRRAQVDFAAGRYQQAVDVYADLYADFKDPTYLRNIGRCYQRMKDAERAIASFEEYLMRAKDIAPAERDEVRGFIKEMESLKRPSAPAVAPAPAAPAAAPVAAPLPAPVAVPPPAPAAPSSRPEPARAGPTLPVAPAPDSVATSASPAISGTAPPPSSGGASGGRIAGGVMVGVAGLAALGGGIALASSWSAYNAAKAQGGGCKLPFTDCEQAQKKVEARNLLSKILLVGAAVIGVTGVTIMVVSPATSGATASGEATGSGFLIASHGSF